MGARGRGIGPGLAAYIHYTHLALYALSLCLYLGTPVGFQGVFIANSIFLFLLVIDITFTLKLLLFHVNPFGVLRTRPCE